MDASTLLQALGMIVGGVVYVETRLRNVANGTAKAREDFREQVTAAVREREASITELRALVEARVAQEAQARAEIERELAEHKLQMVRELREYPTVPQFEKAMEQAIEPLRSEVHRLASLFQAALESGRFNR